MNREKILEQLEKLERQDPDTLNKPIVMRMGEKNHNVVTGKDLLDALRGQQQSFGSPSSNPGGVLSKDVLLNKLNKVIK